MPKEEAHRTTVTKYYATLCRAVNSQTADPDRVLAAIDSTGSFSLAVNVNRPYFLVLLDSSQVGKNMIVAILSTNGLQSFVSTNAAGGSTSLGTVTADGTAQTATISTSYQTLLTALGLSETDATLLRTIQGVALRYANPDIDGNGVIDILENKNFTMDFHVRSNMFQADGVTRLLVSDMTNQYYPATSKVIFNLTSAYVGYPTALDSTIYAANAVLQNGGAVAITNPDGSTSGISAPTSYSPLSYGTTSGFGPDFQLTNGGVELPGSNGTVATFAYTLGALTSPLTLTFTNVGTRTKAALQSDGTIVPFIKFNTVSSSNKQITSLEYTYMILSGGVWSAASTTQVQAVVNDSGGYANIYYNPTPLSVIVRSADIGCTLPRTATGTLDMTTCNLSGVTAAQVAAMTTDNICNMAISYDDKLGLRIFAGDALPNNGTATYCN